MWILLCCRDNVTAQSGTARTALDWTGLHWTGLDWTQYVSNMEELKDETSENVKPGEEREQEGQFCALRQSVR